MSKDEELFKAYLAGFIDGEGYIGIIKIHVPGCRLGFKLRPEVEISGKFGDFLVEVKLKYGGCFMPHKRSGYGDYYPMRLELIKVIRIPPRKRPLTESVLRSLKKYPNIKRKEIAENEGTTLQSVYSCISRLRKQGEFNV